MRAHPWRYASPVDVTFGAGIRDPLMQHLDGRRRMLVVTSRGGRSRSAGREVMSAVRNRDCVLVDEVDAYPDVESVDALSRRLGGGGFEVIIAVGGGSVIDTAKLIAATAETGRSLIDLIEGAAVVAGPPVIAIPTTAGTGSEVTPFATVWDTKARTKRSVDSPLLFPAAAILDPSATVSMPPALTVSTGLDALTQALDSICSPHSNPLTEALAARAVRLVLDALPATYIDGDRVDHRAAMLTASLLSGLAISSTRTGVTHAVSYPLTAHLGMPHGLACAFPLPGLLEFYAARDDGRIARLAAACGVADSDALCARVVGVSERVDLAILIGRHVGDPTDVDALVPHMCDSRRSDNTFARVDATSLHQILARSAEALGLERGTETG